MERKLAVVRNLGVALGPTSDLQLRDPNFHLEPEITAVPFVEAALGFMESIGLTVARADDTATMSDEDLIVHMGQKWVMDASPTPALTSRVRTSDSSQTDATFRRVLASMGQRWPEVLSAVRGGSRPSMATVAYTKQGTRDLLMELAAPLVLRDFTKCRPNATIRPTLRYVELLLVEGSGRLTMAAMASLGE